MNNLLKNLLLLGISSLITLIAAEFGLRAILFNEIPGFEKLREPSIYACIYPDEFSQIFSDDYWKLYYLFGGTEKPPENPHELLGWVGDFDRKTLAHNKTEQIKKRRPVLLYGDSFAQCVNAECFQDQLNNDSTFSKDHYFLNYGVGGFGIGQIHTLFAETVDKFEKPFVVFSLMTRDLERTPLTNRIGQKLFYTEEKGELKLNGLPIESNPNEFFEKNPPEIKSYLSRLVKSKLFNSQHAGTEDICSYKDQIRNVNALIIQQTIKELKEKDIDFLFLVFNPLYKGKGDWRQVWLRDLLEKEQVPYLFTLDILERDGYFGGDYTYYEQPDNGHPTSYQNELISNDLKRFIINPTYKSQLSAFNTTKTIWYKKAFVEQFTIEAQMEHIRNNEQWFENIKKKAMDDGVSTETMLKKDATYILEKKLENSCELGLFNGTNN